LKEILKVIQEIQDKPGRVYALTDVAAYLPQAERAQILQEAVRVAREIEDREWQAHLLTDLIIPKMAKLGYYEDALAAARTIPDDWRRPRMLEALRQLVDRHERIQTIVSQASQIPETLLQEILNAAKILDQEKRAQALMLVFPRLVELGHFDLALTIGSMMPDEQQQIEMLERLVQRLTILGYPETALTVAKKIVDPEKQAEILASLEPHLTKPLLWQTMEMVWKGINEEPRIEFSSSLANSPEANFIHITRPTLLENLSRLTPILVALGGSKAACETIRAIRDVTRWWP
jgi:hypothetical protein